MAPLPLQLLLLACTFAAYASAATVSTTFTDLQGSYEITAQSLNQNYEWWIAPTGAVGFAEIQFRSTLSSSSFVAGGTCRASLSCVDQLIDANQYNGPSYSKTLTMYDSTIKNYPVFVVRF